MANLNKVLLIGNLTRDPELKYLPTNQLAVCDFSLAVGRTWTGQDGIKKEETTFVDCSCFGKTAEILQKYKKKGDPLFVEGRLKLDQWEAKSESGEMIKRSKMRVIIENFQFLNRGQPGGYGAPAADSGAGGGEYGGEPAAPAPRPPARAPGRPAPQARPPQPSAPPPSSPQPNYESDIPSVPEDAAPQVREEDIPF